MYYVYLLQGSNNKFYIGFTSDLKRRLDEHKNKKAYYSKRLTDPKIIYYEAYCVIELAKQREKKLKQYGAAYHELRKRVSL